MATPTTLNELAFQIPKISAGRRIAVFIVGQLGILVLFAGMVYFPFMGPQVFPVFHRHPSLGFLTGLLWVALWVLSVWGKWRLMAPHIAHIRTLLADVPIADLQIWENACDLSRPVRSALREELAAREARVMPAPPENRMTP